MADVDGELLGDEERKAREGEAWVWDGMPAELESSVDVGDVWKRWRVGMPVRLLMPCFPISMLGFWYWFALRRGLVGADVRYRTQTSASPKTQAATSATSSTSPH